MTNFDTTMSGSLYSRELLAIAASRGFDADAHVEALLGTNEDQVALTHPANWLTEDEVEAASGAAHEL